MRRREAALGALLALIVLTGAAAGVEVSRRARDDESRAVAAQELALATGRAQTDIWAVVNDARQVATQVSATSSFVAGLATVTSRAASGVGFARDTGSGFSVEGGLPVSAASLADASATLDLARDAAAPRVLASLPLVGGGERPFVAVPAYRLSAASAAPSLMTTDERRLALLGFVLVGIDVGAVPTPAPGSSARVSVRVTRSTDASLVATPSVATATIPIAGQDWLVAAEVAEPSFLSVGEVVVLGLAAIMAAALIAAGVGAGRRRRAADAVAAAARMRLRLLTSMTPLLQETLELGHVLPELATRVHDEIGLQGIGFAAPAQDGSYRDLYAVGSVVDAEPAADLAGALRAGEPAAIVMHRGGRAVAMLRVNPGRPLDEGEIETLYAAADLATAAIVSGRLFEQQDEAMRRMREVDELKTSFLSTASHELRTPVTAIKGFATLLDGSWEDTTEQEQRLYTSRILANAKSLDALVQDLLDLSRLERGRVARRPTRVDLAETVRQVLDRLSVLFVNHALAVDLAVTPLVSADPEAVERVLTNLASNAVHYSPPGTTVTVRTLGRDGGAELVVEDEGPGVPPEEREKVFSRFFRGSTDAVLRTRGTGIGLAVVKEYVDQMAGTVAVDTAPGGGARFSVWLPAHEHEMEFDERGQ